MPHHRRRNRLRHRIHLGVSRGPDTLYAGPGQLQIYWEVSSEIASIESGNYYGSLNALLTVAIDVEVTSFQQGLESYSAGARLWCVHWGSDSDELSNIVDDPWNGGANLSALFEGSGCIEGAEARATLFSKSFTSPRGLDCYSEGRVRLKDGFGLLWVAG